MTDRVRPMPWQTLATPPRPPRFLLRHAVVPAAALAVASLWLAGLQGDLAIADTIFAWEGGRWALRSNALTEQGMHQGGRIAIAAAWIIVVVAWQVCCANPDRAAWRAPLLYIALCVLLSTGLVSLLKMLTDMDCPWDLVRYGGDRPFVGLLQRRPTELPAAACFPAGHASGGYAWVCLYFAAGAVRPAWRGWGLALGLLAGIILGVSQQLRGAHFLSHDLWTLAVCWTVALVLYVHWLQPRTATTAWPRAAGPGNEP